MDWNSCRGYSHGSRTRGRINRNNPKHSRLGLCPFLGYTVRYNLAIGNPTAAVRAASPSRADMPKPAPRPTMADVLRRAVRDAGESVNAVAKAAGVPQPVLYRFMTGERDLTLDTAQ